MKFRCTEPSCMTLPVQSASRDRYLDGRPPPQPITRGFIKSMVLPVPMEDKASQGPSRDFSTAIYRSKVRREWSCWTCVRHTKLCLVQVIGWMIRSIGGLTRVCLGW